MAHGIRIGADPDTTTTATTTATDTATPASTIENNEIANHENTGNDSGAMERTPAMQTQHPYAPDPLDAVPCRPADAGGGIGPPTDRMRTIRGLRAASRTLLLIAAVLAALAIAAILYLNRGVYHPADALVLIVASLLMIVMPTLLLIGASLRVACAVMLRRADPHHRRDGPSSVQSNAPNPQDSLT